MDRLLEEFYAWFGMTADEVPYTSVKGSGRRRIDAELLKEENLLTLLGRERP